MEQFCCYVVRTLSQLCHPNWRPCSSCASSGPRCPAKGCVKTTCFVKP